MGAREIASPFTCSTGQRRGGLARSRLGNSTLKGLLHGGLQAFNPKRVAVDLLLAGHCQLALAAGEVALGAVHLTINGVAAGLRNTG